jgi:hypothetical protein
MLLDLSIRDRHAALKALMLTAVAIKSIPERRRSNGDRDAIMSLLRSLDPTEEEIRVYNRAAEWILREIVAVTAPEIKGRGSEQ